MEDKTFLTPDEIKNLQKDDLVHLHYKEVPPENTLFYTRLNKVVEVGENGITLRHINDVYVEDEMWEWVSEKTIDYWLWEDFDKNPSLYFLEYIGKSKDFPEYFI